MTDNASSPPALGEPRVAFRRCRPIIDDGLCRELIEVYSAFARQDRADSITAALIKWWSAVYLAPSTDLT